MRNPISFLKLLTAAVCFLPVTLIGEHKADALGSEALPVAQSVAALETSPTELVDEVWQLINIDYIDETFNGQNWQVVRQQYLSRSYSSLDEAYVAIEEMLALLNDSLTRFMDPEEFELMQIDAEEDDGGIGLQITQDAATQGIVVVSPIEGTSAYEAGILPGDVLLSIDGVSTQGMELSNAVSLLRGPVSSKLQITVNREGEPLEFDLTRANVELYPVRYSVETGPAGSIGYIRLSQFSAPAADEMREAIQDLEEREVTGYVLDLRSNPGGLLFASIDIADMWLSKGTIVSTRDRNEVIDQEQARPETALTDKPMVVLIDSGTAAGSEILAAALQDNQRARLVGTPSFGLNSIQSVRGLSDGSGIAVTIAKWIMPSGKDIGSTGLIPDVTVELTDEQREMLAGDRTKIATSADPQYTQAIQLLVQDL